MTGNVSVRFEQFVEFVRVEIFGKILHVHIREQFRFLSQFFLAFFTRYEPADEHLLIIRDNE